MSEKDLNINIKLTPYDVVLKYTLLLLFPWWVRPNHVTVVRFLASPIVFWLLWTGEYRTGLVVFLLVALTDAIDGSLARTRRQITLWGTVYDGVADKCLIGGVVLILVVTRLSIALAGAIIGLELIALIGAIYFKRRKGIVHPANWWGKIKMNLQVLGTVALLVNIIWNVPACSAISFGLFVLSIVFGLMSIVAHAKLEQSALIGSNKFTV